MLEKAPHSQEACDAEVFFETRFESNWTAGKIELYLVQPSLLYASNAVRPLPNS